MLVSFVQMRLYSAFVHSSAQKLKPGFAPEMQSALSPEKGPAQSPSGHDPQRKRPGLPGLPLNKKKEDANHLNRLELLALHLLLHSAKHIHVSVAGAAHAGKRVAPMPPSAPMLPIPGMPGMRIFLPRLPFFPFLPP